MKVVLNREYGGFQLSRKAVKRMREKGWPRNDELPVQGKPGYITLTREYQGMWADDRKLKEFRTHPDLIAVCEELGEKAGEGLRIVEVPDDVDWYISDDDGIESVHEKHRVWPEEDRSEQDRY